MVKVNKFDQIKCLITRTAFKSGKLDLVANCEPFVDFSDTVYMLQEDPIYGKFSGTVKAENRNLFVSGKVQEQESTSTKRGIAAVL